MGFNAKKMELFTLADWQFVWPDVGAMVRWRPRIQSYCAGCSTRLWIPLSTIIRTRGADTCMWGLELPCNRVGCNGWRTFRAWEPKTRRFVEFLPLHRARIEIMAVGKVDDYVEPRKSRR